MPGEICILVYNLRENAVITVQSMRGFSIFVRFKEKQEYSGLPLEELHRLGLEADRRDMGLWRFFFHYNAHTASKRKGALIQAVEAIEKDLAKKRLDPEANSAALPAAPAAEIPAEQEENVSVPAPDVSSEPSSLSWESDNAGQS